MRTHAHKVLARALMSGESLVATAGLAAAAIIVVALAASTLWGRYTTRKLEESARVEEVRAVASMLGQSAEVLLRNQSLSELRSITAGTAASYGLKRVQIIVPDAASTVVVDSSLPRTAPGDNAAYPPVPAPEAWSALKQPLHETQVTTEPTGAFEVRVPLMVPDLGPAILSVRDERGLPKWSGWEQQFGAAMIGVTSLAFVWLAYRSARKRLGGLGAVREALTALEAGEKSVEALMLAPTLGPEAIAWNRLLSDYDQLRERVAQDRAGERIGAKKGRESDLTSACDALWQGLLLVDAKMQIKYVNGAGAVFLRARREDLANTDAAKVLEPSVLEAVKSVLSGSARTRLSVEVERRGEDPGARNGSVLRFSVRPIRRDETASALVFVEDITQQKVADESRNAFVASATHELRTPLTNMRLYIDMMLEDENLEAPKRAQALNVVSTEARRLERIVGDMLSVAEIEAGQLKLNRGDVRLEPIFKELEAEFAEQARQKELRLKFEMPPKWPTMSGDRDKLVLALHNLIGNAVKYTPAGGEISVRVNENKGQLSVDVSDTGIGIKDDESELIFERFYRAKDRRISNITGTGLGLSLAREVVRMHGGDITVHSQIDKGSTFTMTLPLAA